jgi:hypothetical protein
MLYPTELRAQLEDQALTDAVSSVSPIVPHNRTPLNNEREIRSYEYGENERQIDQPDLWETTRYRNLFRYVPSGNMFARFKIRGKQVRKSLGRLRAWNWPRSKLAEPERSERAITHERRRGPLWPSTDFFYIGLCT